jgi:6,7-dimethyl-8-ribityllumazine synthase
MERAFHGTDGTHGTDATYRSHASHRSHETTTMTIFEGNFAPPTGRFALVAARFNSMIVDHLVDGALDALKRHGVAEEAVDLVRVPGSYEVPFVAQRLAGSGKYAAVICLGAVIRGDTDHYDYVAGEAAGGVARAALATGVPVIFGILTCDTLEQALNRAGAKSGNKGFDAALAAIEMVNLLKVLPI